MAINHANLVIKGSDITDAAPAARTASAGVPLADADECAPIAEQFGAEVISVEYAERAKSSRAPTSPSGQ
jgi:hypothetical protein